MEAITQPPTMGPTLIACAPRWLHDFSSRGRAGESDRRGAADPRSGGGGFIGTHLVGKLAEEGRPTRCLVRRSSLKVARDHLSRFGAELVYGDLTDSGSLGAATEGVTTVFPSRGRRDGADDIDG